MKKIEVVTFYFEEGCDPSLVDKLANKAQDIVNQQCSGGGYAPIDIHYEEFSDSIMEYFYRPANRAKKVLDKG